MEAVIPAGIAAEPPTSKPVHTLGLHTRFTKENAKEHARNAAEARRRKAAATQQELQEYATLTKRLAAAALPLETPAAETERLASLRADIDALRTKMLAARSAAQADGYARAIARLVAVERDIMCGSAAPKQRTRSTAAEHEHRSVELPD